MGLSFWSWSSTSQNLISTLFQKQNNTSAVAQHIASVARNMRTGLNDYGKSDILFCPNNKVLQLEFDIFWTQIIQTAQITQIRAINLHDLHSFLPFWDAEKHIWDAEKHLWQIKAVSLRAEIEICANDDEVQLSLSRKITNHQNQTTNKWRKFF